MSLNYKLDIDSGEWDKYVSKHPFGNHEQTSGFSKIREDYGLTTQRVGVYENARLVAGAQLLIRNIPIIGKTAYVNQGPLVDDNHETAAKSLSEALDYAMQSLDAKHLRIINFSNPAFLSKTLLEAGFNSSGYRWGPGETSLVSLNEDNEILLAKMKAKCRYNLRLSQRKGVFVKHGGYDDLAIFYHLYQTTGRRQKFPTFFPLEYFQYLWRLFTPQNKIKLFIAYYDEIPLAAVIATVIGNKAYYGWGGLSDEYTKLMGNYQAHWEAIQWARNMGCQFYDLTGVAGDDGVSRFKRQWGGTVTKYPDCYDKYYGVFGKLRKKMFEVTWDNNILHKLTLKVRCRLYKPMPN